MKITRKPATKKLNLLKSNLKVENEDRKVQVPDDFPWILLGKVITDLGFQRPLDHEDYDPAYDEIDLSKILTSIRYRNVDGLMDAIADFSPQCIGKMTGRRKDIFFAVYQICSLLKKYPFSSELAKAAAETTFRKYEGLCQSYNGENVKALLRLNRSHPDYLGIIEEIREDILRLIGKEPNVQRVLDCAKHGPGSSIGLNSESGMITSYFKWSTLPYTVSDSARPYAKQAIETYPQWIGALMDHYRLSKDIPMWAPINMESFWDFVFKSVNYCRYSSVPKTAKTERSIAIEPTLNVFLQLGVDRVFRARLKKRWHIDLNSQELNRKLAYEGSVTGKSVTIDLQGASEMVTRAICFILLPVSWYDLLDDLRSSKIQMPEKDEIVLAKMSAMGNGFTFALESIVFAALARAAMRRTKTKGSWSVFGDDIIVPTSAAAYLISLLEMFGFIINKDKTFIDGPFRESCGEDYLDGTLVRPFFLKKEVKDVNDLWYVYNSLYALHEKYWHFGTDFRSTLSWLSRYIPRLFRGCYGPISEDLDSYRFSSKPPLRNKRGEEFLWSLIPHALDFSERTDSFFFRKLMNDLKGNGFDNLGFTRSSEGSSYQITLRGAIKYKVAKRRVY